jgi:glutamate synthase domain-containing protein 3
MSGGMAYVYDPDQTFATRCNRAMVALESLLPEDEQADAEAVLGAAGKGRLLHLDRCDEPIARSLIEKHLRYTGSAVALAILDNWENERAKFVKVFPNEYKRALGEMFAKRAEARAAAANKAREVA